MLKPDRTRPQSANKDTSWNIQRQVVFALFTRELKSRFGHFRLGYFWALAEPAALILVMCSVRVAFGKQDIAGVAYPLFFASAIIPFYFFQSSVTRSLNIIESSLALLNYQRVKPADAVLARCLLEFLIYTSTGILVVGGLAYAGLNFRINSVILLCASIGCLACLTLGLALITTILGALYRESQKIIPIIMRPLFFISGLFFTADSLPPKVRDWLLWNPLLHVSELVRAALFTNYESHHGNLSYLALCSLLILFFGLSSYRLNRIRVATSGEIK